MKKLTIRNTVRFLALGGFFLFLYPVFFVVTFTAAQSGNSVTDPGPIAWCNRLSLLGTSMTVVVCYFGYFLSSFCERFRESKRFNLISKLVTALGLFIAIGAGFLLLQNGSGISLSAPFVCASILSGIVGAKFYYTSYGNYYSVKILGLAVGVFLAFIVYCAVLSVVDQVLSESATILIFFGYMVIYLLTKNQSGIDRMMERRKHDLSHLPSKMRRYSLLLTMGIILLILLLFAAKAPITAALTAFFSALREGFFFCTRAFFRWLASFDDGSSPIGNGSEDTDPLGGIGDLEYTTSGFWNILYVVVIILAIIVFFAYRRQIAEGIAAAYRKLLSFLRRIFAKPQRPASSKGEESYYFDLVETVAPSEQKPLFSKSGFRFRDWKKLYKKFLSMKDSAEKYRFGYGLLVDYLRLKKVSVSPSDTVPTIEKKAKTLFPEADMTSISSCYSDIRYGNQDDSLSGMSALTRALEKAEK